MFKIKIVKAQGKVRKGFFNIFLDFLKQSCEKLGKLLLSKELLEVKMLLTKIISGPNFLDIVSVTVRLQTLAVYKLPKVISGSLQTA